MWSGMGIISSLTFIEKVHEHDDVYSFRFEKPAHISHKAGQHSIFFLPNMSRPHPFSITSTPQDKYLSFATHVRKGSRFKQYLAKLKKGDKVFMFGPILNFTYKKNHSEHVFLAQGIGITPFRSMITHADQVALPDAITLIHVESGSHTFKDVTETASAKTYYPANSDAFRKAVEKQNPKAMFYISGSPKFTRSAKILLHQMGVKAHNIKTDSFLGY